ncbi:MAG: molybdopterin converting factor subunit 1 [Rhodospirillaceae bacterium]|jgi:sulfur-carrier protein|nr:molybdopterin converting factor subunit 1 [Rhodospirillaceae bacterium]MBT4687127.1 molybdopterin converting factor subunit 1 [Rhodospirillaceae bacterium]MBT5081317.1 molybdopterin converting factor subunit 1 [Rhodospirillaceae bacterium]MBT5522801.1 molybdopterin converting factor subunit 1 [Rhodospirillaceae bacterium]MBT5880964.1 molybdopterin converting factor subunit 1 [Rhodospirillaceae bacterium]
MKVLYFSWLRDRVGVAEEAVQPPGDVTTVAELMTWLTQQSDGHAEAFKDPAIVRCAINQDYAKADAPISAGDEVAFFPPVTGG